MRADSVPALEEPPPAAVEPGPVAEAVVLELALLFWLKLDVEEVGVVALEVETLVLEFVEHEPEADVPPLARNPQSDFAQLLSILMSTGLAGRDRLAKPTAPNPLVRLAASASLVTTAEPRITAATTEKCARITALPLSISGARINESSRCSKRPRSRRLLVAFLPSGYPARARWRDSLRRFAKLGYGAQGRNRTTDTVIFSHVLYRLSYLGGPPRIGRRGRPVQGRRTALRGPARSTPAAARCVTAARRLDSPATSNVD
jgi:hypothetical protein